MADIEVTPGPYVVHGLPITRGQMHTDSGGGPQSWEATDPVDTSPAAGEDGSYALCRCGASANKPFCDGSHKRIGFDGTETASTQPYREQARVMHTADDGEVVRDLPALCEHAGFCTLTDTNVWKMRHSEDPAVIEQMDGMIDLCPSGRLTRAKDERSADEEPDLPTGIMVVDDGPYLVTGGVDVTRSDGADVEPRNRMTLCRCGASANKPFCDGSHAAVGFTDPSPGN